MTHPNLDRPLGLYGNAIKGGQAGTCAALSQFGSYPQLSSSHRIWDGPTNSAILDYRTTANIYTHLNHEHLKKARRSIEKFLMIPQRKKLHKGVIRKKMR